ncbi:heterogeneous nuclear ribonucleoprotein K-like isoform X2 [Ornithodoros turicata]|uniref:heterogeneous nuclear ribonucleoprotein K-like isoform X2 n=1 Tax=Ornithodoros turicata TaxID=34597 RepID=UPI00313870E1
MMENNGEGGVKRESVDDEGPNKRFRGGGRAVDVRFLLQSRNAGAIIGKGGANINNLRKEFKASISVPDCPGPERILSIVADLDTLGEILLSIIPKLDEHSGGASGQASESEMRLLLHQSHAGCVIGRAGYRIKELREKTGANIKVHGSCCPASTERVVKISGGPQVVVDCVRQVCEIVSEAPIKGLNKPYDPHNYDPEFAQEYGGYAEGGTSERRGGGGGGGGGGGAMPFWRDDPVEGGAFGMPPRPPDAGAKRSWGGRGGFGGSGGGSWGGQRTFQRPFRGGRGGYGGGRGGDGYGDR